ncbi:MULTISPECIES: hypothetical protein [Pedobacter]|uniref:hypothetical protein n=1 Tax=Pedobacter TaxID=84567 RepID=UPI001E659DFD|nr:MULTISPECIES: hypothetical protein [Pedobacter]
MKKVFIVALACIVLSCKVPAIVPIGTSESTFKQAKQTAELVSSVADGTNIYRVSRRTFDSINSPFYSFYYFYKGKLVRYEQSERSDDYKFIQ